jgi:hypothetical protein
MAAPGSVRTSGNHTLAPNQSRSVDWTGPANENVVMNT